MNNLIHKIDIDFIGIGNAAKAYGGKLDAWSFSEIKGEKWFSDFREEVLLHIGKKYLPVYRLADGEYRFLMGRKYNFHKRPLWRELVAVTAEKLRIKNPDKWKTSWGEKYASKDTILLRSKLINQIQQIADDGFLACYINDNGLNAFTEYNKYIEPFFNKNQIRFDALNYIPFHFVVGLLVNDGWQDFFIDKNILVVSGTDDISENKIKYNMQKLGNASVDFLRISKTSSMHEVLDLKKIEQKPDLCLVAAGIGSANIITQLKPINTVILDIGGYINCFIDINKTQHGGVFKFPIN